MPTIFIADDNDVIRQKIRMLLGLTRSDWDVCGEAVNGFQTIEQIQMLRPDLLLLDINMPDISGFEIVRRIKGLKLATLIILLTAHDADYFAASCRSMGVQGCVSKATASKDLPAAIEQVLAGGTCY